MDGRTTPGVSGNGSVPLSHSGNVVSRIVIHTQRIQYNCWTDARHPVPRLWIRSAEVRGGGGGGGGGGVGGGGETSLGEWEHNNRIQLVNDQSMTETAGRACFYCAEALTLFRFFSEWLNLKY